MLGLGCYATRRFACNCTSCVDAKCHGTIEPSAMGQVPSSTPGCTYASLPTLFGWNRRSCNTVKQSAVAATRTESQRKARLAAPNLTASMWVFFQARECPDDDWWLGRAAAVTDEGFCGNCFRKFAVKETLDDELFGANDFAITVQWYERSPSDPARLTFAMLDRGVCVVNTTELRHWLPYGDVEQTAGPPVVTGSSTNARQAARDSCC